MYGLGFVLTDLSSLVLAIRAIKSAIHEVSCMGKLDLFIMGTVSRRFDSVVI